MKLLLQIAILLSLLTLYQCDDAKEQNSTLEFSIDTQLFKKMYHTGDTLQISIKKEASVTIDSLHYFINDKKVTNGYIFKEDKLGYQNIKVVAFQKGETVEKTSRVELASNITPQLLKYTLLNTYPHDINAYTQGLEFHKDTLIESTGQYGQSSIRKTDARSGKIHQNISLEDRFFGEGITVINEQLFQLTWRELQGFVYDVNTLQKIKDFPYHKKIQGWGLCNDGQTVYFSDGTEKIYLIDPITWTEKGSINVYTNNSKIKSINELEYINGKIFANIYQKSAISIIDPKTGAVEGIIDLSELKTKVAQHEKLDVLNGIAYNPKSKTIFVTGKNWNKMFEITVDSLQ